MSELTPHAAPPADHPRLGGHNRLIRDRLLAGPATNIELAELTKSKAIHSRISDLRRKYGYRIDGENLRDGQWLYTYRGRGEQERKRTARQTLELVGKLLAPINARELRQLLAADYIHTADWHVRILAAQQLIANFLHPAASEAPAQEHAA